MIDFALHMHLIAAIAWIGGGFFMFALGVMLRNKEDQMAVYPKVGPIYGIYETLSLVILLISGIYMILHNGLWDALLLGTKGETVDALRAKLWLVGLIILLTAIHSYVALRTNGKQKSPKEFFVSKTTSMGIFILNLVILHYAMVLRDAL